MSPYRNIHRVSSNQKSPGMDDVRTKNKTETPEEIIPRPPESATSRIENEVGINPPGRARGAPHTPTHPHPQGTQKLREPGGGCKVGPQKSGGTTRTVNKGE
jgi:hypothetical protein